LHPTSLPGLFGIGDLGEEAYRFAQFLIDAGQSLWQVLPLGPTDESHAEKARESCLNYLQSDGREINWDFIRAVLASGADTAIIPLQDVVGLGSEARMNTPNTTNGNWSWRFGDGSLTAAHAVRLKRLTGENNRGRHSHSTTRT